MFITSRFQRFFKAEHLKTLNHCLPAIRQKSFAAAMSEALDKLERLEEENKAVIDDDVKVKEHKMKQYKGNLKKRKWVEYKTQEAVDEEIAKKRAAFDPADRVKRKKTALLLGYSGANYFGMQRNPGMATIEEELFKAMLKHKWISDDSYDQAQQACFQRAARTDKGVSAARQVCSVKLPEELNIEALNADLPEQIRLFGAERVTKGFNAKDKCNARTYTYTLPTIAFASIEDTYHFSDYRIDRETLKKVQEVLKMYEGTKNFHNFTSRKNFLDPSAKRFIMLFECGEPFISPQGIEFATIKVKGQSFMLHQIRKMVGLVIAIVRGNTTTATLERAFSEERLDLPMAPGLGLVLDTVHYERYNDRYGNDGIHKPLTWLAQEETIKAFIEKYIFANIYKTEHEELSLLNWMESLPMHSYEARKDDATADKQNATNSKDDDNEE